MSADPQTDSALDLETSAAPADAPWRRLLLRAAGKDELHQGVHRLVFLCGAGLILGLVAILAAPDFALEIGSPSPRDFAAPVALRYESPIRTEAQRDRNAGAVEPVYSADAGIIQARIQRVEAVLQNIEQLRASGESDASKLEWLRGFPELAGLSEEQLRALIGSGPERMLSDAEWARFAAEVPALVATVMERQDISDRNLVNIRANLVRDVDPEMSADLARLTADFASDFVVANLVVDTERTEALREAARAGTPPEFREFSAGQTIVREGDILSAEQYEALDRYGLLPGAIGWRHAFSLLLSMGAIVIVLGALLLRLRPDLQMRPRPLMLIVLLVLAFTGAARLVIGTNSALVYAFPAAAVPMTISVLLGVEAGYLTSILMAVTVGFIAGGDLTAALYVLASGLAGSLFLDRIERIKAFSTAGLAVALASITVAAGARIAEPAMGVGDFAQTAGIGAAQAVMAAGLTALLVLAAGSIFGVTTSFQLLELVRPDSVLLRELQIKAPGTYQHSVVLSNLAEAAANAIGADALLLRTGAYYHDIGKSVRPAFFVENQLGAANPHDGLDPEVSARIIIDHVVDGVRMAEEHHMPEAVIDFIREHHGTLRAEYFYHRAVEQQGEANVEASAFRYPGPRPQSRETAILMVADGSEAAVRARNPQSREEIDEVVLRIIQQRLYAGQLEDSDLTLRDLRHIRRAIVDTLQSMYHPRVQYPEGVLPAKDAKPATAS